MKSDEREAIDEQRLSMTCEADDSAGLAEPVLGWTGSASPAEKFEKFNCVGIRSSHRIRITTGQVVGLLTEVALNRAVR